MMTSDHINDDSKVDILLILDGADSTGTRQGLLSSGRGVGLITW